LGDHLVFFALPMLPSRRFTCAILRVPFEALLLSEPTLSQKGIRMPTTRRLGLAATAVAATTLVIGGILAPAAAMAYEPWRTIWTAPASYCNTVRANYIAQGFQVTPCTYYTGPNNGTGGYFKYRL
jgi:hypothetical protein